MTRAAKFPIAFAMAVLATSVIASVFLTQFVIAELQSIDVDIPLPTRLTMTVTDLQILQIFAPFCAACFAVAFPVAASCARKLPGERRTWFVAAGLLSIVCGLMLLEAVFGFMLLAGARTSFGLASQGVAGAVGGWLFERSSR